MIDTASPVSSAHSDNHHRDSLDACSWCGSTHDVDTYRNEPRCGTCREHETVIDSARRFIGMYGLRPLGGATTSEDDEELEHRTGARAARAALDSIKSATPVKPRKARAAVKRSTTQSVDVAALEVRVAALLEQLGSIDTEIASIDGTTGLPARARMSDLERQRTTVLTTLAALEKARRNAR